LRDLHHATLNIVGQLIQPGIGLAQQLFAGLSIRARRHRNANVDRIGTLSGSKLRGIAQPDMRLLSLFPLLVKIICFVRHMTSPAFSRFTHCALARNHYPDPVVHPVSL
jgi:hypothetical protein